jgi:hypothetical protein
MVYSFLIIIDIEGNAPMGQVVRRLIFTLCLFLAIPLTGQPAPDGSEPSDQSSGAGTGFTLAFGIERREPLGASSILSHSGFSGRIDGELAPAGLDFSGFRLIVPISLAIGLERPSQFQFSSITTFNPETGVRIAWPLGDRFSVGGGISAGAQIYLVGRRVGPDVENQWYIDGNLAAELFAAFHNIPRRPGRPSIGIIIIPGYQLNFESPRPGQYFSVSVLNRISFGGRP